MVSMTRVSVSELKANLSKYLREARRGGEIQVLDRGVPVARLIGLPAGGAEEERRERLIRGGVLRPGNGDASFILSKPPLRVSTSISQALEEQRVDRL